MIQSDCTDNAIVILQDFILCLSLNGYILSKGTLLFSPIALFFHCFLLLSSLSFPSLSPLVFFSHRQPLCLVISGSSAFMETPSWTQPVVNLVAYGSLTGLFVMGQSYHTPKTDQLELTRLSVSQPHSQLRHPKASTQLTGDQRQSRVHFLNPPLQVEVDCHCLNDPYHQL